MLESLYYPQLKQLNNGESKSVNNVNMESEKYIEMWQSVKYCILNEPMLKAYAAKYPEKTTAQCLDLLAKHFENNKANALAAQIKNLKLLLENTEKICSGKNYGINPEYDESGNVKKANVLGDFIMQLNSLNGADMNKTYPSYVKPEKSLLDEAYSYNENNGYKMIQKGPEALLAIRLGQLSKDITARVSAIELFTGVISEGNKQAVRIETKDDFKDFLKNVNTDDAEKYLNNINKNLPLAEQVIKTFENFDKLLGENDRNKMEEAYGKELESYFTAGAKEVQDNAVKTAIADSEKKAKETEEEQYRLRESLKAENERKEAQYKKDEAHNLELEAEINKLEEQKNKELADFDAKKPGREKEISDYRSSRSKEAERKTQETEQYKKEEAEASELLQTLVIDSRLADMQVQLMDETNLEEEVRDRYKETGRDLENFRTIRKYLDTLAESRENGLSILRSALSLKDVDISELSTSRDMDMEKMTALITFQHNWNFFKESNPELKDYFKIIEKNRGTLTENLEADDPYSALNKKIKDLSTERENIRKEHQSYFGAYDKLKVLREKYPKGFPGDREITQAREKLLDIQSRKPADFDIEAYGRETEENIKTKENRLTQERKEISEKRDSEINEFKNKLIELKKPELAVLKSDDEIKAMAEDKKNELFNPEKEKEIRSTVLKQYKDENFWDVAKSFRESKAESLSKARTLVSTAKELKENIKKFYEHDKKLNEENSRNNNEIEAAVMKMKGDKNKFYSQLEKSAEQYFGDMNKGKDKSHKNTPEFESMVSAVKSFKDKIALYNSPDSTEKKPTIDELKTSLKDLKGAAAHYYKEKQGGIHWIPSNMRFVRLSMAMRLQNFADEKLAEIDKFSELENTLTNRLNAYKKFQEKRVVRNDEDPVSYFKRIHKEMLQEKAEHKLQTEGDKRNKGAEPVEKQNEQSSVLNF